MPFVVAKKAWQVAASPKLRDNTLLARRPAASQGFNLVSTMDATATYSIARDFYR